MKVQFWQYTEGGINITLTPETVKEAASLAYFNRNAMPDAKRVASLFADAPATKDTESPLQLSINLPVKPEKKRTGKV